MATAAKPTPTSKSASAAAKPRTAAAKPRAAAKPGAAARARTRKPAQPAIQRIVPCFWSNGTAEETAAFYAAALPDTVFEVMSRYPETGLLDFQRPLAGQPLTVDVLIDGYRITLVNAGPEFRPNPSISLTLQFDPRRFGGSTLRARAQLDATWGALGFGGRVLMELGEYPFNGRYGWVEDRYGVSWQLMLVDPEAPGGDPSGAIAPFVMPCLMFGAAAQNRAGEAIDRYVSVLGSAQSLGGAGRGFTAPYPVQTGPAPAGAVMFGSFRVGEQQFSAMDSGVDQPESFTNGVSLIVNAHGQEEIDLLWDALSAVPEAEQCGWLVDAFGVSWQIVPDNMDELMQRPDAFPHMLQMKKIVIADL